jgi:predicted Holliday junction resolvase-like endonuclease
MRKGADQWNEKLKLNERIQEKVREMKRKAMRKSITNSN